MVAHTETSMPSLSAPVAFKDPMIRGSAIHTAYRIFAAFFIVMGAKTSIVENLFYQPILVMVCLSKFREQFPATVSSL